MPPRVRAGARGGLVLGLLCALFLEAVAQDSLQWTTIVDFSSIANDDANLQSSLATAISNLDAAYGATHSAASYNNAAGRYGFWDNHPAGCVQTNPLITDCSCPCGYFEMNLPDSYNRVRVTYGNGFSGGVDDSTEGVRLFVGVDIGTSGDSDTSSVVSTTDAAACTPDGASTKNNPCTAVYEGAYVAGSSLRIEEFVDAMVNVNSIKIEVALAATPATTAACATTASATQDATTAAGTWNAELKAHDLAAGDTLVFSPSTPDPLDVARGFTAVLLARPGAAGVTGDLLTLADTNAVAIAKLGADAGAVAVGCPGGAATVEPADGATLHVHTEFTRLVATTQNELNAITASWALSLDKRTSDGTERTWAQADAYVKLSNCRLPTVAEARSLVSSPIKTNYNRWVPVINDFQTRTPNFMQIGDGTTTCSGSSCHAPGQLVTEVPQTVADADGYPVLLKNYILEVCPANEGLGVYAAVLSDAGAKVYAPDASGNFLHAGVGVGGCGGFGTVGATGKLAAPYSLTLGGGSSPGFSGLLGEAFVAPRALSRAELGLAINNLAGYTGDTGADLVRWYTLDGDLSSYHDRAARRRAAAEHEARAVVDPAVGELSSANLVEAALSGTTINLARACGADGQQACPSTVVNPINSAYTATIINDGITGGTPPTGQVYYYHAGTTGGETWTLDFGQTSTVSNVLVYLRDDGITTSKIEGYELWIGDDNTAHNAGENAQCYKHDGTSIATTSTTTSLYSACVGTGRYFFFYLAGDAGHAWNEIEVMGYHYVYAPAPARRLYALEVAAAQTLDAPVADAFNWASEWTVAAWLRAGAGASGAVLNMSDSAATPNEVAGVIMKNIHDIDAAGTWVKAGLRQTCDSKCASSGQRPNHAVMSTINSYSAINAIATSLGTACASGDNARTYEGVPMQNTANACYYLEAGAVLDTTATPHTMDSYAFCFCSAAPAWTHVALTYDGSGTAAALHVGGAATASATVTVSGLGAGGSVRITGAAVDDLRVYASDLSGDLERAGAPAAATQCTAPEETFPTSKTATSNTFTDDGYTVTVQVQSTLGVSTDAFKMYDNDQSGGYHSGWCTVDAASTLCFNGGPDSGTYTNCGEELSPSQVHPSCPFKGTDVFGPSGILGFPMQIDFGRQIRVKEINMMGQEKSIPYAFVLLGSNDPSAFTITSTHASWTIIKHVQTPTSIQYGSWRDASSLVATDAAVYYIDAVSKYRYYTMVVQSLVGSYQWIRVHDWGFTFDDGSCPAYGNCDPDDPDAASCAALLPAIPGDTGGWRLVRHIPATGNWFSGDDDLAGDSLAGTGETYAAAQASGTDTEWTKLFGAFDEYVISTGDHSKWMRFTKAELGVQTDYATQSASAGLARTVLQSHSSPTSTSTAYWLWRGEWADDPWISYNTHADGEILYGEGGSSYNRAVLAAAQLGINVFVREAPAGGGGQHA